MSNDEIISVKDAIERYKSKGDEIRAIFARGIINHIKSPEGIKSLATGDLNILSFHLNDVYDIVDDIIMGAKWTFKLDIEKKLIVSYIDPADGFIVSLENY